MGVALLLGAATSAAAERVLFIGNSFTFGAGSAVRFYRNHTVMDLNDEGVGGVPALFESFTEQAGLEYDVSLETRGGTGLDFHLAEKRDLIERRRWDIVVAHGYSTLDADQPRNPAKLAATAKELADVLRARNPRRRALSDGDLGARRRGIPRRRGLGRRDGRDNGRRRPRGLRRGSRRRGRNGDPRRRRVEPSDARRRRGREPLRRHRRRQARSLDLRPLPREHATATTSRRS